MLKLETVLFFEWIETFTLLLLLLLSRSVASRLTEKLSNILFSRYNLEFSAHIFIIIYLYFPIYYPIIIHSKSHIEEFLWVMHPDMK